jgi:hypothetical protein
MRGNSMSSLGGSKPVIRKCKTYDLSTLLTLKTAPISRKTLAAPGIEWIL